MSARARILGLLSAFSLSFGLLVLPTNAAPAPTPQILNCRFGPAQVFDVQWNISGSNLNISGITWPAYGSSLTFLNASNFTSSDYLQFFPSTTAGYTDTYGLKLVKADNSEIILDEWGTFRALGDDFIFYNGYGRWGTVFTTSRGYSHGESATLPISINNPSMAQVNAFTSCSSNVAAAGQQVSNATPTPTPTPTVEPTQDPAPVSAPVTVASVETVQTPVTEEPTLARTGATDSPLLALALILMFFGYTAYSIGIDELRKALVLKWLGLDWLDFKFK